MIGLQNHEAPAEHTKSLFYATDCKPSDCVSLFIEFPAELDYVVDYMGKCACGCGKELYKGMTVLHIDDGMIYVDCWQDYIYKKMVTL